MEAKMKIDCSNLIKKIRTYSNLIVKGVATDIRDDLTNTAADALIKFYEDYPNPKVYKRHWDIHNFINKGNRLSVNSFKKYYVHYSNIYNVGVLLSPYADSKQYKKPMIPVYNGTIDEVFYSVYHGFHGLSEGRYVMVKPMRPSPLEIIEDRRKYLINNIDNYIEFYKKKYINIIK